MSFLGLPILFVNYKSTVIPIILSVWVLNLIYKRIDKLVPDFLKILLTSMIVLFILVPPRTDRSRPYRLLHGHLYCQVHRLVLQHRRFCGKGSSGRHPFPPDNDGHALCSGSLQIQQIAETGGSTLLVSALTANFSQAGAGFGAFLRLKDKEMKSVAGSASLSPVLGITPNPSCTA